MKTIHTLSKLIEALNDKTAKQSYLDIMKQIDIPLREFEKYYTWNKERYTRNCLAKTDQYELLLICYEKGQETPIHDFAANQAWIHTIHGKLREERFIISTDKKSLQQVSSITLSSNDFSYMKEVGIHRYKNIYESRSVTLNLYCKPIKKWIEYDEKAGSKEMSVNYDSVYV